MVDMVDTLVVDKNRQAEGYPKGARIAGVHSNRTSTDSGYDTIELRQRDECIKKWEDRWGPIPWDRVRISHRYLTFQILTELVVYPEGY